jgi:hypothetical protein
LPEYVYYSEPLILKLEDALKLSFGLGSMHLTRPRKRKSKEDIRVTLQGGESNQRLFAADGETPDHHVMEIITQDNRRSGFWFGFSAIFESAASEKHALEHVSVLVFQDILGDLIPLFRAEWAQSAVIDVASKHAQPHWHFTQSPARIESLIRTFAASDSDAVKEFSSEGENGLFADLADFGMFHFAMTHLWEGDSLPASRKRQFDSNQFPKWFKGLTDYIAEQISYLVSHMPTSVVTTTDFVPPGLEVQS